MALDGQGGGVIEGKVTFSGSIPRSEIPDNAGLRRRLIEVNARTQGAKGVVVFLLDGPSLNAAEPGREASDAPVTVDQMGDEFSPRVVAVRAGQPVVFSNSDPANHNVRSSVGAKENQFNIFIANGGTHQRKFKSDPEHRPVVVGCDIHPWMRGWIYVFDHPFFALTDERGEFRISGVPEGTYRLAARQPDLRYRSEQAIEIRNGAPTTVEIRITSAKTQGSCLGP